MRPKPGELAVIHYVARRAHLYTVQTLIEDRGEWLAGRMRPVAWEDLLERGTPASGTWIFTDLDRLDRRERQEATRLAHGLESRGCKVLNRPDRVLDRQALLRRLHECGVNPFTAYRAWRVPGSARHAVPSAIARTKPV